LEKLSKPVAVFDLDYTLLEGDCEALWSQFLFEKGIVGAEFVARIQDYYGDYEKGQLNFIEYEEFLLLPTTVYPLETLSRLRDEYLEHIQLLFRSSMVERVEWHRSEGHTLLMITASNSFLAKPIADRLRFPNLICTQVNRDGDTFTNHIDEIPAFQDGKVRLLDQWLVEHDLTLGGSWGYSDSHNDLPLLNQVEHPIAVRPDHQLEIHALEHGWKIISA
jgi:HAD superfamily hydrolase (TIGR01490 family)